MGSEVKDITDDLPFEIPDSWVWCHLGNFVLTAFSGKSPKYSKEPTPHKIVGQQANQWDGLDLRFVKYATEEFAENIPPYYYLQDGDVLLNTLGNGTLGRSSYYRKTNSSEFLLTDGHIFVFRTLDRAMSYYLKIYLKNKYDEIVKSANGSTNQTFLSLGKTLQWFIPVPPLTEQARIVAEIEKFEPLIAEYDKLEQQATKLDEEIYDQLKKSILQYAIQGKLVPQDPNEEPASVLIERIRAEKKAKLGKKYVDSFIYKGDDNCYYEKVGRNEPVRLEDLPFEIPDSWCWARLKDVTFNHGQKIPNIAFSYIDIGSIDNVNQKLSTKENIVEPEKAPSRARKIVERGDVLYATVRPYLHNMCVVEKDFSHEPIASTGFAVLAVERGIENTFLFYYMLSPIFDQYANSSENSKGVAYPAINDEKLYKALIPIPPQKEQQNICKLINNCFSVLMLKDEG